MLLSWLGKAVKIPSTNGNRFHDAYYTFDSQRVK